MAEYRFTEYFEKEVLSKRPYLRREWWVQAMKLNYYSNTDSLYIDLSEHSSASSREISDGIVLDYDKDGSLVGIDIDIASEKVELTRLVLSGMPGEIERKAG